MSAKLETVEFHILNVKLLSHLRKGSEAYIDIFDKIFSQKIHRKIASDKRGIIRKQTKITDGENIVLYGVMSRFTVIDGAWFDLSTGDPMTYELPKGLFPNLQETEYVFVPDAHRLAIIKSPNFSLSFATKFLQEAIKAVIEPEEDCQVIAEKSSDIFDRILKAESLRRLEISITYTNADITSGAVKWVDRELRKGHVNTMKMIITPDQNGDISLDSKLIKGALGLAKSNGSVKAGIVENDKRVKIDTDDHPELVKIQYPATSNKYDYIFQSIMQKFRGK